MTPEQQERRPTVAIIGSHPQTRQAFDFSRTDCDIWVFNEALSQDWCKRADAVFQIHRPVIWRSRTNRNDADHYDWLQRPDIPTVYMQEVYEDVPNSQRYPLEQVLALVPGKAYLTSSVAYAMALAVWHDYQRIELYGIEMETSTEYSHQRQGVAFWAGVAMGRGIEFEHYTYKFWNAPLYGYEGDATIDIEHYRKRIEDITPHREKAQQMHDEATAALKRVLDAFIKDYKADQSQLDELIVRCGQTGHDFGAMDSAIQVNERYLERCETMTEESGTYLIVRQEFEGAVHAGGKEKEKRFRETHVKADRLQEARRRLRTNANQEVRKRLVAEFAKHLAEYIKASTRTGMGGGIMQENLLLLQMHDRLLHAQGNPPAPANEPEPPLEFSFEEDIVSMEAELENLPDHR